MPPELISIFDAQELELLISGLPDIDLDDLRAHTDYNGYKSSDPQISYFWSALRSFTKEEKALFLQFVTGTAKVPLDGFQSLQGSEGVRRFNIHKGGFSNETVGFWVLLLLLLSLTNISSSALSLSRSLSPSQSLHITHATQLSAHICCPRLTHASTS